MEIRLSELIGGGFFGSHRAVRSGAMELVESGGRGSGKSSFLSIELLLQLVKHPGCHALAVRKVANTLRTSVYTQLQWAMAQLGIADRFKCSLSPLEMEYLPTGQKILFFGMDDAGKLKSLKMATGYIGLVWFEEMDQLTEEEVRSVEQSVFRGGEYSLALKSFNPPKDPGHWVNVYAKQEQRGKFVHHSTYLQLPSHWLGERFLAGAEQLKKVNPTAYRHEYLGQCVGTGEQIFPNVRLESIDSGTFGECVSCVDWGWWPDPWAFNRLFFDKDRQLLYIFDEITKHRASNKETAKLVLERIAKGEKVIADSSEEKSIADYRSFGIQCRGARKGPGSIGYSIKWLQSLEGIVIDPVRCPDTAREFTMYRYVEGAFPDKDNHHIDAVRYGTERFWRLGS